MSKLPDSKQMEFANGFAARFPTLAGKEQQQPMKPPEQDPVEIAVSLTPHQLRRARARAAALDAQTGVAKEPKAFAPRWAVLTSLPARRPEKQEIQRPIGDGEIVHFVGRKDLGPPYAQDRLLPIFVMSAYAALDYPEDRIITFKTISVIRTLFAIQDLGTAIKLREGLRRWLHTGISTTRTTIDARTGKLVERTDLVHHLIEASKLYCEDKQPNQTTFFQNAILLSEWSANQAKKSVVPVRLALVRALRDNPGACSLALWSGYRANGAKREIRVPLFGPEGLTVQLGYTPVVDGEGKPLANPDCYEACRQITRHLAEVKASWPQCPHEIQGDEFVVRPYKTPPMELPNDFRAGVRRATSKTVAAIAALVGKPEEKG